MWLFHICDETDGQGHIAVIDVGQRDIVTAEVQFIRAVFAVSGRGVVVSADAHAVDFLIVVIVAVAIACSRKKDTTGRLQSFNAAPS